MNKSILELIVVTVCMTILYSSCNQCCDENIDKVIKDKDERSCFCLHLPECPRPKNPIYAFSYFEPPLGTTIPLVSSYTFLFNKHSIVSGIDVSDAGTTGSIKILHKGIYKITYMLAVALFEDTSENAFFSSGMYLNDKLLEPATTYGFLATTSFTLRTIIRGVQSQCIVKLSKHDTLALKIIDCKHTSLVQNSQEPQSVLASIVIEKIS